MDDSPHTYESHDEKEGFVDQAIKEFEEFVGIAAPTCKHNSPSRGAHDSGPKKE
jgi:hypothetical protein